MIHVPRERFEQDGCGLLAVQGLRRDVSLELGRVLLAFRHLRSPSVSSASTTSDYEEARWPPARPRAALRQMAPPAASYTTRWGTTPANPARFKLDIVFVYAKALMARRPWQLRDFCKGTPNPDASAPEAMVIMELAFDQTPSRPIYSSTDAATALQCLTHFMNWTRARRVH